MDFLALGKLSPRKGDEPPMAYWFWMLLFYSFFGYLLERMFAKVTLADKQVRKCFLLLPLCPVYGLAMALHLVLLPQDLPGFWRLALRGALVTTAVEYLVHLFYDRVLGVRFWDYTGTWGQLRGRICLPFSAVWRLLSALAVLGVQREPAPPALRRHGASELAGCSGPPGRVRTCIHTRKMLAERGIFAAKANFSKNILRIAGKFNAGRRKKRSAGV